MNVPIQALLVEDDPSWQSILAELLEDCGLRCECAASLESALPLLRARAHRLAVVDLSLEAADYDNRDGLEVLAALHRHDPACAPILLTGYATVELAVAVLTGGEAVSVLRKETFSRAAFRELVRKTLALPPVRAAAPADAPLAPESPPAAAVPRSGRRALLAEDDAGWRSLLADLLAGSGWEVRACACFGDALGLLRREKFHLAVVDLSLTPPGADCGDDDPLAGLRLLNIARAARIPALVVSGAADPQRIEQTYAEQGVFAFLEKQAFRRDDFLRAAQEASAGRVESGGGLEKLTEREWEVLERLGQGMTNKEIAEALVITPNTVKRHLKSVFEKLGIHTRAAAAARAAGLSGERA